ncbi:MAG TPA: carboxypeptidase regulatory-like domain-containing protein [Gemmatimonadaceae bacterium]|nr:carboxypeptidase regulatory-like domain-containing protein [Gemmatimonadaceae bacterium]
MSFTRSASRARLACAIGVAIATVLAAPALTAQATGAVQGVVRAAQTDVPLSYSVVSLPQLSLERFADDQGKFTLAALPVGRYEVIIRRIGYQPFRGTVQVDSAATSQLAIALVQIPVRLATTTVHALSACSNPGIPDRTAEPDVYTLYSLLRENADRYRLLASAHPFFYLQVRALAELRDTTLVMQRVDTVLVRSAARRAYRPGGVVIRTSGERNENEYTMAIPTLLDLADEAFVRNHCFGYGGFATEGSETWVRIDVRASDRLDAPDVNGSFFLDSATAQLRRMSLTLSRAEKLPRNLKGVTGISVTTSFRDIASGVAIIDKVCAVHQLQPGGRLVRVQPVELQQLLIYEFSAPPPDVKARAAELPPMGWRAGARLPQKTAWCAAE